MKIRSDFVSNSSSSSFIFADSPIFEVCNITKHDIFDALVDAYGKEHYNKYIDEHQHGYECLSKADKQYNDFMNDSHQHNLKPFYVYDMNDPLDRKAAIDRWEFTLTGWIATNCYLKGNELEFGKRKEHYEKLIDGIQTAFGIRADNLSEVEIQKLTKTIYTKKKQPNGCYKIEVEVPQYIKDTIIAAKHECGIVDNAFVLKSEYSRFFIHFEDNEAWHNKVDLPGKHEDKYKILDYDVAKDNLSQHLSKEHLADHNEYAKEQNALIDSSIYETNSDTMERLFEIIYNWLIAIGKIVPTDLKLLDLYGKDHNGEWYTENGMSFTWRDLMAECLTMCAHEG